MIAASTSPSFKAAKRAPSDPKATSLVSLSGSMPERSSIMRAAVNADADGLALERFHCGDLGAGDEGVGRAVDQDCDDLERDTAHGGANDRSEDHRVVDVPTDQR